MNSAVYLGDALPAELYTKFWDDLDPSYNGWTLSNRSRKGIGSLSWTRKQYDKDIMDEVANVIKDKVSPVVGFDLTYERCNVNGQTSGQVSEFHTDYEEPGYYTAVLFCCPYWDTQWGGTFTAKNPLTSKYEIFPYLPNGIVIIPGEWDHYGESPNHCIDLMRVTVAFMFRKCS